MNRKRLEFLHAKKTTGITAPTNCERIVAHAAPFTPNSQTPTKSASPTIFVTPEITVGAFISYQTNIESISRQTLQLGSGAAMTTAQKHTLFELPFGVVGRYNFLKGSVFQPYAGLRIGADYAEMSSYYYTIQQYQDTWGVYLSPEIGVSIFPSPAQRFGFHVALFYSYASNNDDLLIYTMNNINRFGVRVGISF